MKLQKKIGFEALVLGGVPRFSGSSLPATGSLAAGRATTGGRQHEN